MRVLVTGSSGLIGSEAVTFFDNMGFPVMGVDNNMRADFFGPKGDTTWNRQRLETECRKFSHTELDIRDRKAVAELFQSNAFDLIIHAAAQPSHDLAASRPYDDFDVNAVGTLNLLEACRQHTPDAVIIHVSTNKVYGDGPNHIPLKELETRWDYDDPAYEHGIAETFSIDNTLHSLFGASKAAGEAVVRSYAAESAKNGPRVWLAVPPAMPTAVRARFHPGEDQSALTPCAAPAEALVAKVAADGAEPGETVRL